MRISLANFKDLEFVVAELRKEVQVLREGGNGAEMEGLRGEMLQLQNVLDEEREIFQNQICRLSSQLDLALGKCDDDILALVTLKEKLAQVETEEKLVEFGREHGTVALLEMEKKTVSQLREKVSQLQLQLEDERQMHVSEIGAANEALREQQSRAESLSVEVGQLLSKVQGFEQEQKLEFGISRSSEFEEYKRRTDKQIERFKATEEVIR